VRSIADQQRRQRTTDRSPKRKDPGSDPRSNIRSLPPPQQQLPAPILDQNFDTNRTIDRGCPCVEETGRLSGRPFVFRNSLRVDGRAGVLLGVTPNAVTKGHSGGESGVALATSGTVDRVRKFLSRASYSETWAVRRSPYQQSRETVRRKRT
jgi:hypothetical protein